MSKYQLFASDVEEIVEELMVMGEDEIDARTDYSGRGMYGATCLGFVVPVPHRFMLRLGRLLGSDAVMPEVADAFEDFEVRTDQMGLSTIVYFPFIEVVANPQEVES